MIDLATIIDEINQQIGGEAFARLLNYHPDKIQISGATLKCFCPVHHELAFRSLILNLKANTYKCTMKRCAGFEGGTYVHFWSIYRELELIEAALDLAEQLKLPIDVETLRRLGTTFAEKALADLEAGNLDLARTAIDQALAFDPRNLPLRLLSARIWQAAGDPARSLEEQVEVFDAMMVAGDLAAAQALLVPLLTIEPTPLPLLERQVELACRQGDTAVLSLAFEQLSLARLAAGQLEGAITALEDASRLAAHDGTLLERLVDLYGRAGRPDRVLETLAQLSALYEAAGQMAELLISLERRAALRPQDLDLRAGMAQILEQTEQADEARAQWLFIVQTHVEQGRFTEAEAILTSMLTREPQDVELLERQARILTKAGDSRRAVAAYRQLAALAQEVGLADRVGEYFELARGIDPHDLGLRRDQAEWKLAAGQLDSGLNDLFTLADLCLEQGEDQAQGMAILDRIAELAPTDLDKRLRIGRCLERNDCQPEAFASYCALARDFMRQQQFDAAQAICEEARRLRPLDIVTLDLRIETHLALKQKSEAIEACREVARAFIAAADLPSAEVVLLRAARIDHIEIQAKIDLATLYETMDRQGQAAQIWIAIALFHRASESHDEANAAIREALRLEPANREAKVMLAEGLEAAGQAPQALAIWIELAGGLSARDAADPEALKLYRHALELAPLNVALLDCVARLTLTIEGAAAAKPCFESWLDALDGQSDVRQALMAYRLSVEIYPEDGAWRGELVGLLLDADESDEAAGHLENLLAGLRRDASDEGRQHAILEQLVALRPERLDLRGELAQSLARQGRVREAVAMFRKLGDHYLRADERETGLEMLECALAIAPNDEELIARSAQLFEQSGRNGDAIAQYERLAELQRRHSDTSGNIPILEKLLAYDPARLELRAELAELYEAEGDLDRAIEQHFVIAQARAARPGEAGRAVDICLRIRALAPEFVPARELLIESWLTQDCLGDAKDELDNLGDLALAAGKLEIAETYFKRIQEIDPEDIGCNERLGKLYEAHGRLGEAAEVFQRVLDIYDRLSETSRAIGVMQKLKSLRPDDLDLRGRLARLLLEQSGERREAGDEWLSLIELALRQEMRTIAEAALAEAAPYFKPDWAWRTRVARALTMARETELAVREWRQLAADANEAREFAVAREAAGEGLQLTPDQTSLRELRIEANRRLSNYESAAQDLRTLAERLATQAQYDRAEQYLNQALELQPRSADLLEMLAEIQSAGGHIEAACATQRRLAEFHRQEGELDLAIRHARRLLEMSPEDAELKDYLATILIEAERNDEAITIWQSMAEACAADDDSEAAIVRYARILEFLPGNIDILRRVADLTYESGGMLLAMAHYDRLIDALHAEGDPDLIEYEYLRILELEPGHLQLKERMADFLREQDRAAEARELLLAIVAAYRDERDQLGDAIRVLRHLKSVDPEATDVREQEALLLERLERTAESAQAWRQLAGVLQRSGNLARAAECLTHVAQLEDGQADAQLDVAEMFEALEQVDKAIQFYLRAIEIHDRNEHLDQCVPILERAIRLSPLRFDLGDALARIYERLEQFDLAARQWLELGALYEKNERQAAAHQVYLHLCQVLPELMEGRQRLARLCEEEGDRTGALRELRELARLAGQTGDLEPQADYLMRVLALDPNDEPSVRTLADIWRKLGWVDELFETLATLERLYCASGKYGEALATLDELKGLKPEEPELMGRSIDLLIKTGQAEEAARQGTNLIQIHLDNGDDHHALETLRRIAEIEPGNIERRITLARLIHANQRESAALQEFFLSASKLFGETEWAGCLRVCEAGLELFADEVRLRDLMGRVLVKLGRQSEAIEVQLHLAALYDERGEDARAARVYETILEDQPDHQATLEAMVDWALRHEKISVAIDHLIRLAESHYLAGRLDRAIGAMERIQTLDPARLDLKARLAEIYHESGDESGAITTWLAAARGMLQTGRHDTAIELFERLMSMCPGELEVVASLAEAYGIAGRAAQHQRQGLLLGDLYLGEGRQDRALEVFEDLVRRYEGEPAAWERLTDLYANLERHDDAAHAYYRLFEIHRGARRLDQARLCLEAALARRPGDLEMLESLGDLCLALGRRLDGVEHLAQAALAMQAGEQPERARDLAQRILKLDPLNLAVRRLLGEVLEATGNLPAALDEAMQAARGYADARQNEPALAILNHLLAIAPSRIEERELYAKLLHREGRLNEGIGQYLLLLDALDPDDDPRRAIKYCRQILSEQPDHPEAHACLCKVYERSDKLRQAFKECEWLADYYLTHGVRESAESFIQKGLAWFPDDLGMRTRLVDLLLELGRRGEAATQLSELARMAEAHADTKTTAWAIAKACEIEPDNLENYTRLADYQERTGNLTEARQTRLEVIRLMLAADRMEEARTLSERIVESVIEDEALRLEIARMFEEAGLPEVAAFHYHHLARRALTESQLEEAKNLARHALRLKPRHVGARETLIEAMLAQRENKDALDEYERLYEIYHDASEWDSALRTLQAMIDLAPSAPGPRGKLIQLYRRMHREEAMVDQLRRLAEIHVNANDFDAALECLRDLMGQRPEDTHARVRYIDLYTQFGEESDLIEDYLQLARIFSRKGSVIEATRSYEKVMSLHPQEPACREEFVQFLFEQSQVHRAIEETRVLADLYESAQQIQAAGRVLDRALNYAPQELELRQRLASIYMRTNRRGLALETFRTLARHYEQAGNDDQLLDVTEKIVQIDGLNVEFRQRLADLYHRLGSFDQAAEQYKRLAEQYIERGLFDLAEHEYRRLLEIQPENLDAWHHVIEIHLQIGSMREIIPDLMMLADLYSSLGRIKDAVGIYRRILDYEPENLDILARYIDNYSQIGMEQDLVDDYLRLADLRIKRGEVADAIRIYRHLMELSPENQLVRDRLSSTQRLAQTASQIAVSRGDLATEDSRLMSETQEKSSPLLTKVIRNYENVLRLNPNNPTARAKLAELLEQSGDSLRADAEWALAAESFLAKGDLERCIEISEHYLERHPEDGRVRERLSRALVQRDSLRAIDGALAFDMNEMD